MISKLDLQRLSVGSKAPKELSDDPHVLKNQIDQLSASLRALQSLDDLGSPEANNQAMANADAVLTRLVRAEMRYSAIS